MDAITSQHELWHKYTNERNIKKREKNWLIYYKNFENFKTKLKIKFFKYEDFVLEPNLYGRKLMNFCRILFRQKDWIHIKPVSIGRYRSSLFKQIKKWKISSEMALHMKKYNYLETKSVNLFSSYKILLYSLKRYIPLNIKSFFKKTKKVDQLILNNYLSFFIAIILLLLIHNFSDLVSKKNTFTENKIINYVVSANLVIIVLSLIIFFYFY